jgi:hypothetical protein
LGIKCVPFFTANFVQNISPFDEHWMWYTQKNRRIHVKS